MTPKEGRNVVRESGILLLPEWDLASTIAFDTIRRKNSQVYATNEEDVCALQGSTFNTQWDTLAIWALAPSTNKPEVVEPIGDYKGGLIIKRVSHTLVV